VTPSRLLLPPPQPPASNEANVVPSPSGLVSGFCHGCPRRLACPAVSSATYHNWGCVARVLCYGLLYHGVRANRFRKPQVAGSIPVAGSRWRSHLEPYQYLSTSELRQFEGDTSPSWDRTRGLAPFVGIGEARFRAEPMTGRPFNPGRRLQSFQLKKPA
jgi:hypothetical protein